MEWHSRFTQLELTSQDPLPDLVVSHLRSWNAIYVTGEDRLSYLQGQLTCDLVSMDSDHSTLGAHCDPKGKVWNIYRCFQHQDGYALFHHSSTTDASLQEIKKYSVFSKVAITVSSDVALAIIGTNADSFIDSLSPERGKVRRLPQGSAVKIAQHRWLLLINHDAVDALLSAVEISAVEISAKESPLFADETIWDKLDIEEGIPRIIESNQNAHIPQAFNLQAIGGISFTKGCYTGQETVARAKYRGTNKRAMYIVKGLWPGSELLEPELERKAGESWRSAGSLLASYRYNDGTAIGLIILPTHLEPNPELRLSDFPDSHWRVETLPYSLRQE